MPAVQGDATDEMLMVRYQRGEASAFAELARRHGRAVYNFVLRQLRDRKLLTVRKGRVHIHDLSGLRKLSGFQGGYLNARE